MARSFAILLAVIICCVYSGASKGEDEGTFIVDFHTDIGSGGVISIEVNRSWAPLGADHFLALVKDSFYNECAFTRVVPNFVLQFGIAGIPSENVKWDKPIMDDPVVKSNTVGTITYATSGANTRTTQLFINYIDNSRLDAMGFAPFGRVIAGMDVASAVFNPTPGSSGGVDQNEYENKGNTWIRQAYPKINFIVEATVRTTKTIGQRLAH